jgi:hypothetical protein
MKNKFEEERIRLRGLSREGKDGDVHMQRKAG